MSASTLSQRKPYSSTPYAALEPGAEPPPQVLKAAPRAPPPVDPFLKAEAEKLAQMRDALWAAFRAAPEAGLPADLIDLTIAYTGALKLELSLLGLYRLPAARTSGVGPPLAPKDRG